MPLPNVNIEYENGQLGRTASSNDGIAAMILTGVAVASQFALGEVIGPLFSLQDVEAKGITPAYDTANATNAHKQCKDFYTAAGEGAELYLMVVSESVTMETILDPTGNLYATKLLNQLQGKVKLLGVTRMPASYNPTITQGIDPDVIAAVTKAQLLAVQEQDNHRPVQIIIEGRDFQGDVGVARDFRTGTQNRVSVLLGWDSANSDACLVGLALGRLARIRVQRNLGCVEDGDIGLQNAWIGSNRRVQDYSNAELQTLYNKGYIFPRSYAGLAGFYWCDDSTATSITDDYAFINRGRVIDKIARIAYDVYVRELNRDFVVDADTGRLTPAVIKAFQRKVERAIEQNMVTFGEISGVQAFADPNQDVLATDKVVINIKAVPAGMGRNFDITLGFSNPNAN
ncbi:DUF2586 domain-containing protein [Raineya sp.]